MSLDRVEAIAGLGRAEAQIEKEFAKQWQLWPRFPVTRSKAIDRTQATRPFISSLPERSHARVPTLFSCPRKCLARLYAHPRRLRRRQLDAEPASRRRDSETDRLVHGAHERCRKSGNRLRRGCFHVERRQLPQLQLGLRRRPARRRQDDRAQLRYRRNALGHAHCRRWRATPRHANPHVHGVGAGRQRQHHDARPHRRPRRRRARRRCGSPGRHRRRPGRDRCDGQGRALARRQCPARPQAQQSELRRPVRRRGDPHRHWRRCLLRGGAASARRRADAGRRRRRRLARRPRRCLDHAAGERARQWRGHDRERAGADRDDTGRRHPARGGRLSRQLRRHQARRHDDADRQLRHGRVRAQLGRRPPATRTRQDGDDRSADLRRDAARRDRARSRRHDAALVARRGNFDVDPGRHGPGRRLGRFALRSGDARDRLALQLVEFRYRLRPLRPAAQVRVRHRFRQPRRPRHFRHRDGLQHAR